jgi:hypothetical protein
MLRSIRVRQRGAHINDGLTLRQTLFKKNLKKQRGSLFCVHKTRLRNDAQAGCRLVSRVRK